MHSTKICTGVTPPASRHLRCSTQPQQHVMDTLIFVYSSLTWLSHALFGFVGLLRSFRFTVACGCLDTAACQLVAWHQKMWSAYLSVSACVKFARNSHPSSVSHVCTLVPEMLIFILDWKMQLLPKAMAPACVMLTARSTVLRKRAAFPPRGLMCIKVSMKSACCAMRLHAVAWPCLISVSFLSCSAFSSYRLPTFAMASFSFRNCSRGPETAPRQPQPFPNGIHRVTFNPPPTLFLRCRLLQKASSSNNDEITYFAALVPSFLQLWSYPATKTHMLFQQGSHCGTIPKYLALPKVNLEVERLGLRLRCREHVRRLPSLRRVCLEQLLDQCHRLFFGYCNRAIWLHNQLKASLLVTQIGFCLDLSRTTPTRPGPHPTLDNTIPYSNCNPCHLPYFPLQSSCCRISDTFFQSFASQALVNASGTSGWTSSNSSAMAKDACWQKWCTTWSFVSLQPQTLQRLRPCFTFLSSQICKRVQKNGIAKTKPQPGDAISVHVNNLQVVTLVNG